MPLPDLSVQESSVPYQYAVLNVTQDTAEEVTVELRNRSGVVYAFDPDTQSAVLTVKEYPKAQTVALTKTCTINADGTITVSFEQVDLDVPGVWHGEFAISTTSTGTVTNRVRCFMNIDMSFSSTAVSYDPVCITDVRTVLQDRGAEDNVFLDEQEFSDGEVCWAVVRAAGLWNESPPKNSNLTYTQITFPYKENLLDGVVGELLHSKALNLVRNRMPVQAGGLALDDHQRADIYMQLGDAYKTRYRDWMAVKKSALNMEAGFGATYNPYF